MKLISMTDFVLEHKEWRGGILSDACIDYANFLKQPLTLDMFIGDKALFEDWQLIKIKGYNVIYQDEDYLYEDELKDLKIEDLKDDQTLTQHAIKQLGL